MWSAEAQKRRFWRSLVFGAQHFIAFWLVQLNSGSQFPKLTPYHTTFKGFPRGGCMKEGSVQSPYNPLSEGLVRNPIQPLFQRELHTTPCNPPSEEVVQNSMQNPFQRGLHPVPIQPPFERGLCATHHSQEIACNIQAKSLSVGVWSTLIQTPFKGRLHTLINMTFLCTSCNSWQEFGLVFGNWPPIPWMVGKDDFSVHIWAFF